MRKSLAKLLLSIWGFRVKYYPVQTYPKLLYIVMPHTSGWDVPLGALVREAYGLKIEYVGKKALFSSWYGPILRYLGGHPIDRSGGLSQVEGIVQLINSKERFHFCITPEGTRKKVDKLKTGFYYIARQADIPITLIKFDFGNKVVSFSPPYYLSDDIDVEMEKIKSHYQGVLGKVPANSFNP